MTEFYAFIGKKGGVQKQAKPFVASKRVYCPECLTTHEEGKHKGGEK